MTRPTDKAILDKISSPFLNEEIYSTLFLLICWLLCSWLMESLLLGFMLLPIGIFVIVGAALLLMVMAAPVLVVLYYAALTIAALFSRLFKKD